MIQNRKKMRLLRIVILVIGALWVWASAPPPGSITEGKIPAPQKGFLAPNFTLENLDGGKVTLSDYRGQAVLINLWATWCPPCRAEMPDMQEAFEMNQERGFVILAINATNQDHLSAVDNFVKDHNLTFPILLDSKGEVSQLYQLRSLPTSFFVDTEGIIQDVIVGGPMSGALLRTRIENLLPEKP
ncbi:MAG: TlpA disulfide reductase family protein [Chloroflexota bacterium]